MEMQSGKPSWPVLGLSSGSPDEAEPPYHVRTVDFMLTFGTFDPDAAQRAVPAQLTVDQTQPGFMALYRAPSGWGLAPYEAFFVALPVLGHNSPDGSSGYFMAEGHFSGRAGRIMHGNYNRRLRPGEIRQSHDGTRWQGEVGPAGDPFVRYGMTPVLPRPDTPLTAGVHHYLGERHGGGLNIYSVAYSTQFYPSTDVEITFGPGASPLLRSLGMTSIAFSSLVVEMPLTFSPPRPVGTPQAEMVLQSARMSLLDLLARLARPAALISESGNILFANEAGEALLRAPGEAHPMADWDATDRSRLQALIARAGAATPSSMPEPVIVEPAHLGRPVIFQAIPVSAVLAGERSALLLFEDPARPVRSDSATTLELLGLTPAEARIAAHVGGGQSAREAASALGLSENTVRSTLQVVYDKLQVQKQSELVRIVLRLEGFSSP